MTDQELYEALGIQHFESGGDIFDYDAWMAEQQQRSKEAKAATAQKIADAQKGTVAPTYTNKYAVTGPNADTSFNPNQAADKGFDWTIDAKDFQKFVSDMGAKPFNPNVGEGVPTVKLGSGQNLQVSGRSSGMEFHPKGEVTAGGMTEDQFNQMEWSGNDSAGSKPSWDQWVQSHDISVNPVDHYSITTDASKLLGRDDSGRYATVDYVQVGDKMVPMSAPQISDYSDRSAIWREGALKFGTMLGAAVGAPYLMQPGGVAASAGLTGVPAAALNAGVTGTLANTGLQAAKTGKVDLGQALRTGLISAATAGAGEYIKGTDAFKTAVPDWAKPGTLAAAKAAVGGQNPLTAFVGAEIGAGANEIAKVAADKAGLDWNKMPQWARDSMVTAVGSAAKGNTEGKITSDVANVMFNAGLNSAKDLVNGTGTIPYKYDAGNNEAVPWLDDSSAGGNGSVQQWYKDQVAGERADYTPEQLDALSRVTIDGKNSISGYTDDTVKQLQDAGLTDTSGQPDLGRVDVSGKREWVPTDDTDVGDQYLGKDGTEGTGALDRVTVTGKKEDLLPIEPQTITEDRTVTPATVTTPTDQTPTDKTGTDTSTKPTTTTTKTTPTTTTPTGNWWDKLMGQDMGLYHAHLYDLDAPFRVDAITNPDGAASSETDKEKASSPEDQLLKYLNGSSTLFAASGGSIDDLLQILRR